MAEGSEAVPPESRLPGGETLLVATVVMAFEDDAAALDTDRPSCASVVEPPPFVLSK
jgi:hypothetical protein